MFDTRLRADRTVPRGASLGLAAPPRQPPGCTTAALPRLQCPCWFSKIPGAVGARGEALLPPGPWGDVLLGGWERWVLGIPRSPLRVAGGFVSASPRLLRLFPVTSKGKAGEC